MPDPASDASREACERLIAAHQGRLFGFVTSLLGSSHHSEEVVQLTHEVVWKKWSDFEEGTNFRAWLFQIARFEARRFRERQTKEARRLLPLSDELADKLATRAEEKESAFSRRRRHLRLCLEKLPERQREVVDRRYFKGERVDSIAEALELKPNAVSQLLFRARVSLLECIESQASPSDLDTDFSPAFPHS